jgi:putative holliday junction resolvase
VDRDHLQNIRAIGLDVGSKTIGVAVSDEMGFAAHPRTVLIRRGTVADVAAVLTLLVAEEISFVVIGMPYELSGNEGLRAKRVRVFATALKAALPATVEYAEQDERFTTAQAERVLIDAGMRRDKRKNVIDQQAAALILQGWLDARRVRR